jgi:c(7)-type cytochrome triheme protein
MKLNYIYPTVLLIAIALLLLTAFSSKDSNELTTNKGIIKFSHKLHADIADCTDCHTAVTKSTSLNDRLMPNHDNCGECHDVNDDKNCTMCHYDGVFEPLIQKKVNLIFNHSFHLDKQKLDCDKCHKGVKVVEYAEDSSQPFPIMEDCYSCHNDTKEATNACEACHVSTAELIPQSHKSVDFIHTHRFAARETNANCVMCHNQNNNSCQTCHDATSGITENNTPNNFYQPYAPNNFKDGSKQQQISRVHDLNYVYTHGIDAKGRIDECQTCHQVETFCVQCHQSDNEDFSMSGTVPFSHLQNDFMRIGVGSGGGEHAVLARRDIESCVACHDVQGGDPTCIRCHMDPDGIKGTNPRTHPSGFMHDVHGDWHETSSSICYNCHTNASPNSPAGVGFCGYCHGAK